jgi:hypothetical protein
VALNVILIVLALLASACTTDQLIRICQNAGARYTRQGCDASTPAQKVAKEWCETHGGVYLAGQEYCAFGAGGA